MNLMAMLVLMAIPLLLVDPAYAHGPAEKFLSPRGGPIYALAGIIVTISLIWARRRGLSIHQLVSCAVMAIKSSRLIFFTSVVGMAVFYTATTALNRYSYIPDWVPYYPKLWTPDDPNFDVYAVTWRLSKNWQVNYNEIHGAYLLTISPLFGIAMALLASLRKFERASCAAKVVKHEANVLGIWLGVALNLLTAFSCCIPAFMLFLYPVALVLMILPFEDSFGSVGIGVIIANIVILSSRLIKLTSIKKT